MKDTYSIKQRLEIAMKQHEELKRIKKERNIKWGDRSPIPERLSRLDERIKNLKWVLRNKYRHETPTEEEKLYEATGNLYHLKSDFGYYQVVQNIDFRAPDFWDKVNIPKACYEVYTEYALTAYDKVDREDVDMDRLAQEASDSLQEDLLVYGVFYAPDIHHETVGEDDIKRALECRLIPFWYEDEHLNPQFLLTPMGPTEVRSKLDAFQALSTSSLRPASMLFNQIQVFRDAVGEEVTTKVIGKVTGEPPQKFMCPKCERFFFRYYQKTPTCPRCRNDKQEPIPMIRTVE